MLVGATYGAYLGRDKARKAEKLSAYINQYNELIDEGSGIPKLTEKLLFDSLISKLDGATERNVTFWKSVEEVHFRVKELKRFIDNHKLLNQQSNLHLKPAWQELDNKRRSIKRNLVFDAEALLNEIDSNSRLVPVFIKSNLNQVKFA